MPRRPSALVQSPKIRLEFPYTTSPEAKLFRSVISAAVQDAMVAPPPTNGIEHSDVRAVTDPQNLALLFALADLDVDIHTFIDAVRDARSRYKPKPKPQPPKQPRLSSNPRAKHSYLETSTANIKLPPLNLSAEDIAVVVHAVKTRPQLSGNTASIGDTKQFLHHLARHIHAGIELPCADAYVPIPLHAIVSVLVKAGLIDLAGHLVEAHYVNYQGLYYTRKHCGSLRAVQRPSAPVVEAVLEPAALVVEAELEPAE